MTEAPNVDELAHQFSDRCVGQPEWIVYAWGVLATAGVVPPDVDEMHTNLADHLVTLAALAYLAEVINNNERAAQVPETKVQAGWLAQVNPRMLGGRMSAVWQCNLQHRASPGMGGIE